MARKFHQSPKDKRDESTGMKAFESYERTKRSDERSYKRKNGNRSSRNGMNGQHLDDYSSGLNARKRMEAHGSGMIHENNRAVANLPQEVMMKQYMNLPYLSFDLDDDIDVINNQITDDVREARDKVGMRYPEKW